MPRISDGRAAGHSQIGPPAPNKRVGPDDRDEMRYDGGWRVHVDPARYLALPDGCPHAVVRLLLVLEIFARTEPYCWPSNPLLARWMGLEVRQLASTLKAAVDLGCVAIVDDGTAGRHRLAIVLLRRLSAQAAAETPEALRFVREHVLSGRHRKPTEDPQRFWSEHLSPTRPESCEPPRDTAKQPLRDAAEHSAGYRKAPLRGKPREKKDATQKHQASNDQPAQQREREVAAAGSGGPKTGRVRQPKVVPKAPANDVIPFTSTASPAPSPVLETALARLTPPQLVALGLADVETRDRVIVLLSRGDLAARKSAARLLARYAVPSPNAPPAGAVQAV